MAGGVTPNRPGGIIEGINVTPLVDIMLVLLVIFIVTAKILVAPAVPLDLPRATKTEDVQIVFSVSVPADGPTQVNGQPVGDDRALEARAREAVGKDLDVRAVIQADGSVPHRRVIATLDALRRAGLTKVAFGTQPADEHAR
jgi:biopolymer transport protein TolR